MVLNVKFWWYITKLFNVEEENDKYERIINEFEDIFDDCPYHSDEATGEIFKKFWL